MKTLQEQYETSEKALKELKDAKAPELKLAKAALVPKPAAAAKDEV